MVNFKNKKASFIKKGGYYWEAGLFLRNPFTEGSDGASNTTLHLAVNYRRTIRPTTFSSVQFSSHFIGYYFLSSIIYSKFSSQFSSHSLAEV